MLRKALGPTLQYEVDSLLSNLSLSGHHMIFVSLADPLGTPSPMEVRERVKGIVIVESVGEVYKTHMTQCSVSM